MAKHILERGEHPVFYYGSAYGGSVEPHYVAAVFVLLGSTLAAYRVAMGGLVVLTITGVYAIARLAFGRSEAILAAAYLAVPPFFFLYKGLTSDGHYNAFNLFVVVTMITSLAIDRTLEIGRERWPLFALLGFAAGVGWWINPITPPISAAAVAWLFLKKRPRPRVRNALQLVAGFVLGSAPWLIWNIRHGWVSLTSPELASVNGSGALHNLGEIVRDSLPLLAGGSRFRTTGSRDTFPFSRLAVGAALIVLFAPCLWRAVRGDRVLRLFVLAFGALVLTVIWSGRYVPTEPRLLFPFYVLAPPVIAAGFVRLGSKRPAALLAAACGAILAVGHGSSLLVEHRHLGNTATEVTGPLDELLGTLTTRGVRHVYTDYWTAYRLAFESDERIVATPIPGDEAVRYSPYLWEVARDPSTAIVVRAPRAECLEAFLEATGTPHRRVVSSPFTVFLDLPSTVLEFVRTKEALPLPDEAFRVAWTVGPQPREIPRGSTGSGAVSFRNESPCAWPHAVHLGYHWSPRDPGLPYIRDGGRQVPHQSIAPGETVSLSVPLNAPAVAGRYDLEYDLVFENVAWFTSRGSRPAKVPVTIR